MADEEQSKKSKTPSGALNVERRTWDIEHFQEVAKERLEKVCSSAGSTAHVGLFFTLFLLHPTNHPISLCHFIMLNINALSCYVRSLSPFPSSTSTHPTAPHRTHRANNRRLLGKARRKSQVSYGNAKNSSRQSRGRQGRKALSALTSSIVKRIWVWKTRSAKSKLSRVAPPPINREGIGVIFVSVY